MEQLPNLTTWVRSFFGRRMDLQTLWVYADWLEENGRQPGADFFHQLTQWQDPRRKGGEWRGNLVHTFYDLFGGPPHNLTMTDSGNSWFFHPRRPSAHVNVPSSWGERNYSQMERHIVYPGEVSYRMSLTNGQWSVYNNTTDNRVGVVSARHQPTADSERHYPRGRVSLRDYKPIEVGLVPEDVLYYAFYHLIEKQVRGGS